MSLKSRLILIRVVSIILQFCFLIYLVEYPKQYNGTLILIILALYCLYTFLFINLSKTIRFKTDPWERNGINICAAICALLFCINILLVDYSTSLGAAFFPILIIIPIIGIIHLNSVRKFIWLAAYYIPLVLMFSIPLLIVIKTISRDQGLYLWSVLFYAQSVSVFGKEYRQENIDKSESIDRFYSPEHQ